MPTFSNDSFDSHVSDIFNYTTTVTPTPPGNLLPEPVQQKAAPRRRQKKSARISGGLTVHWLNLKKRIGTGSGTAPSTSSMVGESSAAESSHRQPTTDDEKDEVDEVIVDRVWSEDLRSSVAHSDAGVGRSPEKSNSHQPPGTSLDHESADHIGGFWGLWTPLVILRWRLWPVLWDFFTCRFIDQKSEEHYRRENWFIRKRLAMWSSLFFLVNWILGCAFVSRPLVLMDKIFLFGVAPAATIPIVCMIVYDFPRDRPNTYQVILCISTWSWSYCNILAIWLCGFYHHSSSKFTCGTKDFLGMFYYTSALQTIALFALKLHRLPALIGAAGFFILSSVLILPIRVGWTRNMINFLVYQVFLLYVHYMRENADRRLFILRDQLKIQFRATQKAQVNERKAADSKRRLTSYVFHEVRVPLNTALLAVQNMEASGTVAKGQEIEFTALEGSLSMMSKVLNDVLDFNRMDSGRFESLSKPYAFHQVMRSLFIPLRLATNARQLEFVTDLDPNIDLAARQAAYSAMGQSPESIAVHMKQHPEGDGVVLGDETRLRQIITNLASNACKFTPAGGKLIVSTRLLSPTPGAKSERSETTNISELSKDKIVATNQLHSLSTSHLTQHNLHHSKPRALLDWIVVRIEVTDTGCGIRPKDMAQSKLFSPFNQTELGRQQGGKGTGLGLALVRQIVKLSGGRLGVRSKVGEGSTFWVELPLGVGSKTIIPSVSPEQPHDVHPLAGVKVLPSPQSDTVAMGNAMENADAAAELRATQVSPASTRSSAALHSLMEQGGRVELIVSKRDSDSPVLTRTIGDASTGTQFTPVLSVGPLGSPPKRPPLEEESSSSTTKPRVERPGYLPLPSPQSFSLDPGPATSQSSSSSPPPTPVGMSNSRGSFTSATSPIVDPGLEALVVDDDPLTRMLMSRLLSRLGCNVSTAENGEMALEMILGPGGRNTPSGDLSANAAPILEQSSSMSSDDSKYHVVFLDNQMPVLSGIKTVEKLRELGRADFVIGVTGNALLDDQNEYLEAGVDHVLTKPVLERNLRSMVLLADEQRKRASPSVERPRMNT